MSPAAQGNVEIDQYFGNNLIARAPKNNYQRQNTRQFHNSQTRIINNFPCEQTFGKPFNNGSRSPKYNQLGYPRQTNFVDINSGWANMSVVVPIQNNQRRYQQYHVNNQYNSKQRKGSDPSCNNETSREPFSHMAVHSQNPQTSPNGGKFNSSRSKLNYNKNNQKIYKHVDKSEGGKQNQNKESPSRSSDALSNASDESSGQSENSLPRIIKPRKRRKKDRKPLTESTESQETSSVVENATTPKLMKKPQVKILPGPVKPYTPVSFEQPKASIQIQSTGNPTVPTTTAPTRILPKVETSTKDDIVFNPVITDSFVNLILDEGNQNIKKATISDKPVDKEVVNKIDDEQSTVCQCRYCDPSGVIWDVEQRCYSPFLTPPAPNEPKLFINSIRPVISANLTKSHGTSLLLRRSWSEPTESSLMTVRSRNKSDSYEPNSHDLQVSSEIITSPNGHRDIEIKFFSTPKRYSELQKPSVPYSLYLPSPPISPWKKEVRFGDLFSQPNDIRPSVNVSP
uniref:Uncharacterized protein n=1 Tax=Cacopsylla melanoneura TaxID=428564 RepID=A0A8D8LIK1_9HEMI